jgi:hypothetical protein
MELNPYISGLLISTILGLPTGLSIVETLREDAGEPKKDENVWDHEWDIE